MLGAREQYNILCLGPSGTGKTTVLAHLVGDTTSHAAGRPEPTIGFNIKTLPIKETVISIRELGGSEKVVPYWEEYFTADKAALIFVVDSSFPTEWKAAKDRLRSVLQSPPLKHKPILLLGTHGDKLNARPASELRSYFGSLLTGGGRESLVVVCSSFNRDQIVAALEGLLDLMLCPEQ